MPKVGLFNKEVKKLENSNYLKLYLELELNAHAMHQVVRSTACK